MLAFDEPLDWMAVTHWLAHLRNARGQDLLRVKGSSIFVTNRRRS